MMNNVFLENIRRYVNERECEMKLNFFYVFDQTFGHFISLENVTDYTDIANQTVRVVVPEMPPYVQIDGTTNKITGFVGDIWNVFEEFLKFKTELTKTNFTEGIFEVLDNRSDVMLTAGIAVAGYRDLEFSQPYVYNWYQLYMRLPSRTPNSTFYIRTLTPIFWYACIAVFLLLTVTLRFTIRIFNRIGSIYYGRYLEPPLSLPSCFLTVVSGFFNQGFDVHVVSYSARAQVIIALVFGYMVYTGMSAVLVSELAVSELQMPIKSLDDVVNKGKWSLCVRRDSFVNEILMDDRRYNYVLNSKGCKNGYGLMKNIICKPNVVVLESQAIMTTFLLQAEIPCEVLTIQGKYYRRGNSLVVRKLFRYKKLIYTYLERLRSNGILQKLQNQWVRPLKIEDINPPATIEVTLYHVKGILVLYASTVLFSFIVLIIECIISKCNKPHFRYID